MSLGPSARLVIEVFWGAGLVVALVATLVVLKQSLLILSVLGDILQLGRFIEAGARKLADNLQAGGELLAPMRTAQRLPDALGRVSRPLLEIARALRQEVDR